MQGNPKWLYTKTDYMENLFLSQILTLDYHSNLKNIPKFFCSTKIHNFIFRELKNIFP